MSGFIRVGGLPMLVSRSDGVYVLPEDGTSKSAPIGGPFKDNRTARFWIVEYLETQLTPDQRAVWVLVMQHHRPSGDGGLELGLIDMVRHGRSFEQIARYTPRRGAERRVVDRRMAAAGDLEL